ncbi:lipase member M-like [Alligator mississippiensis]|uniref:Lipase n=1 Tax=Alligator mississippiensis TaxID=8496 RepID=A0A151P0D3_ALLMI|nr:lipase member M-like [Alligator mississippiensis]
MAKACVETKEYQHCSPWKIGTASGCHGKTSRMEMWLFVVALCLTQGSGSSKVNEGKCHVNPEQFMTISEMISSKGYPNEDYEVLTDDGYYLGLNRIPHGRENPESTGPRPAVLLQHGLVLDGSSWVANLPHNSLGFMLADAGYDVWLGNSRGNSWSRRHQNLSVDHEAFWDFSFHEMAIYDLPAMINFILHKTGQEKIFYGGHSQGSVIGFIAFSMMPQLAQKVKMLFVLGPAYTLRYSKSLLLHLLELPDVMLKLIFGKKELCLLNKRLRAFTAKMCSSPLIDRLCAQFLFLNGGFNKKNLNVSRTDVYMSKFPDYTSVKNILHWGQNKKTGEFKYFDYGCKNKEKYNQTTPPLYKIEDMIVPTALWSGGQDWVCPSKDLSLLLHRITNLVHYKNFPDWDHWDFIWGLDAAQRMYSEVLYLMERYR